jgi:hypothetical protein
MNHIYLIKHNIKIYFLRADERITDDSIRVEGDTIHSKWINNFSGRLIDKTLKGFKYCLENTDCQYILRTNLSSFFDIPLFKTYLESIAATGIYAGKLEDGVLSFPDGLSEKLYFCSGAGYLLSKDIALLTLERYKVISHHFLDDVWLGLTLIDVKRSTWDRYDICDIQDVSEETICKVETQIKNASDDKIFHFRINNSGKSSPRERLDQIGLSGIQKKFFGD